MPMERSNSTKGGSGSASASVLSIECVRGGSRADEWTGDMLQTGDIVEELRIGQGYACLKSPFKNGKAGVQKILHSSYRAKQTSIVVLIRRREDKLVELQACIVPNDLGGKKQYMLRSISDPNYAVGFIDRTESQCLALQETRSSRMVEALESTQLQDGYVPYPWERRMQECLQVPNSSCFLSMLFLPKASDGAAYKYNDLDDTLARANTWLHASQETGVPIVFMNIQTESLLTKISGQTASSTVNAGSLSDLTNLANASLYGFEDYHGVDIGVVRAVRLWYSPIAPEVCVEVKLKETDTMLGFAVSRTEQGFIYISSVIDADNAPSTRAGLGNLFKEAKRECKLLVISRVSNQKVLPWLVSPNGAIRCFDTVSLSHKLSLHRHAKVPILLHVFFYSRPSASPSGSGPRLRPFSPSLAPSALQLPPGVQFSRLPDENQNLPLPSEVPNEDHVSNRIERDTAGESSFRFHDFALPNNWV